MSTPLLWPDAFTTLASSSEEVRKSTQEPALAEIEELDLSLLDHFKGRLIVDAALARPLVSFQANKDKAGYR